MGENEERGEVKTRSLRIGALVEKRRGNCTTPPPKWRVEDNNNGCDKPFAEFLSCDTSPTVSARKLCASLWGIESRKDPVAKIGRRGPTARRRRPQKSCDDQDQPASASGLERPSTVQHRRAVEKSGNHDFAFALQPVSSSVKVTPRGHSVAPASAVDLKLRMVGPSHSLKTSTELIKVLNRIWSLEEQNASNDSLLRELKTELDHSRARVKELMLEKESDRQDFDELVKQVTDDKLFRKREQDRVRSAVQSVFFELQDERKLRKHSEALQWKRSQEISELKSSFSKALRELDRERKARILLENLCDEFAKGISDYEHEVRGMKNRPEKERSVVDRPDRLILHISEAWLDERMQMKLAEAQNNKAEKTTIVDKLGFDISTFLQAKSRRYSLESIQLNEAPSAPRIPAEEGDSTDDDSLAQGANKGDHKVLQNEDLGKIEVMEDRGTNVAMKAVDNFTVHRESCIGEESLMSNASKVMTTSDFGKSECSSRWPIDVGENTLMTQLIEARLERKRRSLRTKPLKG